MSTLQRAANLYAERIRGVCNYIPDSEWRRAFASSPDLNLHQLWCFAHTCPKEVRANPALPLLSLEDPELYAAILSCCDLAELFHSFYGLHDLAFSIGIDNPK